MQFGLSESQQILKNNARKFFAAECPMAEVRRIMETDTAHDEKLWRSMAEQGFLGVVIPEEAGGMGLGMVELAALAEEMGRALVPGAFLSNLSRGGGDSRGGIDETFGRNRGWKCEGDAGAARSRARAGIRMRSRCRRCGERSYSCPTRESRT